MGQRVGIAAEQLQQHSLLQFPTVMGSVVPIVNIPGIEADALKLTGELLAEIYLVAVVVRDVLEPEHDPVAEERDAEPVVSTSSLAGARSASTT